MRWPDNLFADDAYFYLQVAWNFAHGQGSTFNGLMPTNGYHPLWMLVCAAVARCAPDKMVALHGVAVAIALLNLLTLAVVAAVLRRLEGRTGVAVVVLVAFLFMTQLGTEGALTAACLAGLLLAAQRLLLRPSPARAIAFTTMAALTVLSRLDSVFLVGAIVLGMLLCAENRRLRSTVLLAMVIPLVLWAGYLCLNKHVFGTWMPISGALKLRRGGVLASGWNLPHIAVASLVAIVLSLALRVRRRDEFFRAVEVPAAVGVLLHAAFIALRMGGETRWSWYYTTWVVMAAVTAARTVAAMRWAQAARWIEGFAVIALVALGAWNVRLRGHERAFRIGPALQQAVVDGDGIRTVLAFDKPGRIAYFTTARVIPLDGLMTSPGFQQELGQRGVAEVIERYHVDGFVGPAQPLNGGGYDAFCARVHLGGTRFRCEREAADRYGVSAVDVFARLPGTYAGSVQLPQSALVWTRRDEIAVWRIRP